MIWLPGMMSQGGKKLPPVGKALNDYTWEEIRLISDAGLASEYFSVGDRKAVTLNGTVGSLSLSGTYYCYIIGINHNAVIEGTNRIHFQFGFSDLSEGAQLAFVDGGYENYQTTGFWFCMNNVRDNAGGWKSSRMRTFICPAFENAMPSELQNVLKSVTKFSDNIGGGTDTASFVTATSETVFLLSEYEVFGKRTIANSAEQEYQAQYAWYSTGNTKGRYCHNATSISAIWWLRSTYALASSFFCAVSASDGGGLFANTSLGFAPAFCV